MSDGTENVQMTEESKKMRNGLYRVKNTCDTLIGLIDDELIEPDKVQTMMLNVFNKHFS